MHSQSDRDPPYSYIENPRGTFECNCGFKYTKSGAGTTEVDEFRFETIVAFGQLWEQKYLECSDADRQNFQSIAYNLSINYGNISRNMLRKLEALWKALNNHVRTDCD
ncbi:hypothetical protein WA1_49650 [Scytonema hofmannii PCC 7110]|uniref:Transposon Tn7 transposition protein TnsD C-terminal domain-containing protein n=1 Tax=Scytonema hofmannii PCC 7110 TaxID=128403 RepID=A0A139WQV4_9CYAN|nr:hypothetical protein WA1_49650 [Scytonema hofmannii PCC 7110]